MFSNSLKKDNFQFQDDIILTKQNTSSQFQNNGQKQNIRIPLITKFFLIAILSSCFLFYKVQHPKYAGSRCVIDQYHELTFQANRKMYNGWDNTIIGVGQFLMDGWVIFIIIYWLVKYKNIRFPSAAGVYFICRAFMLNMQKFPFPKDIVWHSIEIPAVTVPYGHTRDFYYSGHTGTLTLLLLQFLQIRSKYLIIACGVSLIYMINMLTISRIHYSIDIIGALIFSPFWFRFVKKNLIFFDTFWSLPYFFFQYIRNSVYGSENQGNQNQNQGSQMIQNQSKHHNKQLQQRDNIDKEIDSTIKQKTEQFSQFQLKASKEQFSQFQLKASKFQEKNETLKFQNQKTKKNQVYFQCE